MRPCVSCRDSRVSFPMRPRRERWREAPLHSVPRLRKWKFTAWFVLTPALCLDG